ncbi:MAG: glycosyltransferase family 8 protein, partial [Lachnospiraceae bacterium]|nr:glycosyltransferase family 8 protein [Lachnospiraceae bacterium]
FIQHPDITIHVYAMHMDLSESDRKALASLAQEYNNELHFLTINRADFSDALPTTESWPLEAYFRLQLTDLLPRHIDRILYLDVDMIILSSLSQLYHEDFEEKLFCVCKDMGVNGKLNDIRNQLFEPLYNKGFIYFNSGIMLWNIASLRKQYNFRSYMELAASLNYQILAPDQDLLNYMHWNQVKYVDEYKYNLFARLAYNHGITQEDILTETHVIHYTGFKPWSGEYVHYDTEQLWWDYAKLTPFYHEFLEEFLASSLTSTEVQDTMEKLIEDKRNLKAELDKTVALCQKLYAMINTGT